MGHTAQQGLPAPGSKAYNNDANATEAQLTVDSVLNKVQLSYVTTSSTDTVSTNSRYRQLAQIATVCKRVLRHDRAEPHIAQGAALMFLNIPALRASQAVAQILRATSEDRYVERTTHYNC